MIAIISVFCDSGSFLITKESYPNVLDMNHHRVLIFSSVSLSVYQGSSVDGAAMELQCRSMAQLTSCQGLSGVHGRSIPSFRLGLVLN